MRSEEEIFRQPVLERLHQARGDCVPVYWRTLSILDQSTQGRCIAFFFLLICYLCYQFSFLYFKTASYIFCYIRAYSDDAYLLLLFNCTQTPEEKAHKVRIAAGSGLRADVWKEFSRRFGKIQICEAYGLTEASIGFVNYTTEIGPIGRASYFNKVNFDFQDFEVDHIFLENIFK